MEDGIVKYRMMGEGEIPMDKVMMALRSINYEGYLLLRMGKTLVFRPG